MEGSYYLCSENKGADQLCGYREADLSFVFAYKKGLFSHDAAQFYFPVFPDDMASLIQTCGGDVVPDADCLRNTERTPLIVTCSDIEDEDGDVQVSSQDIAMFNSRWSYDRIRITTKYKGTSCKHVCVMKTPLHPTYDSKTGVYRGIHFFFCSKTSIVGTVLTCTHNQCFEQK